MKRWKYKILKESYIIKLNNSDKIIKFYQNEFNKVFKIINNKTINDLVYCWGFEGFEDFKNSSNYSEKDIYNSYMDVSQSEEMLDESMFSNTTQHELDNIRKNIKRIVNPSIPSNKYNNISIALLYGSEGRIDKIKLVDYMNGEGSMEDLIDR